MAQINWGRLFVGSLIAAIIMFVTDGLIHEMLAKADWHALYEALGAREPEPHGASMAYFAIFELGRGFTARGPPDQRRARRKRSAGGGRRRGGRRGRLLRCSAEGEYPENSASQQQAARSGPDHHVVLPLYGSLILVRCRTG